MAEVQDLQLLIKPAGADCNLACRYCFYRREGKRYAIGGPHRMSDDVLKDMVRRYLRLRLRQSVFCWQGGEPTLMGLDFFRRAVAYMQSYGSGGQSVSNAFQTNGLLIDKDWCSFFRRYSCLVGLSLDGPVDLHDAYRVTGGGAGSHEQVMGALRLMHEEKVEFNILSVVTDLSASHATRIYHYLRELGIRHMQFIPCVEVDPATGRPTGFSVPPEAFADFLCELFDVWLPEAKDGISIRLFDGLVRREWGEGTEPGSTGLCYLDGACGTALVVEHSGDVYPCDFFVQPEWRLGNVRTMSLEKLMNRGRIRAFRGARYRLPEACHVCDWRELCRGGCLKDRQRISGGFDTPTYFCKTYQRLFAHVAEPLRKLVADLKHVAAQRQAGSTSESAEAHGG